MAKIWTAEQGTRIHDQQGNLICIMGVFSTPADCQLVAAAPELLAALRGLMDAIANEAIIQYQPIGRAFGPAVAAIEKAESK